MMSNTICNKVHRYDQKFESLQEDQGGAARHKCCGCAYEQGLSDRAAGRARNPRPEQWATSQAGVIRHRDAMQAYQMGFETLV